MVIELNEKLQISNQLRDQVKKEKEYHQGITTELEGKILANHEKLMNLNKEKFELEKKAKWAELRNKKVGQLINTIENLSIIEIGKFNQAEY